MGPDRVGDHGGVPGEAEQDAGAAAAQPFQPQVPQAGHGPGGVLAPRHPVGGDFSFIDPVLVTAEGTPRREDAAGRLPGLWYLGLRWLRRRCSGILYGFPGDAAVVADAVSAHLGGRPYRKAARPSAW